jgi:formylglycine-generating enzyme required for sulfatase activity
MVEFAAGSFEMGNPGYYGFDSADTRPRHTVTLDPFAMMAYKVSYENFDVFTDSVDEQRIDMDSFGIKRRAPRKPAGVSWYGAKAYCLWLGKLTGKAFDLPTEAQWEYAARSSGKDVLFATDNGKIDKGRNYPDSWKLEGVDVTRPPDLGSFPPNPAGLYGMIDYDSGEWVQDWYDPHYYEHSPANNPTGGAEQDSINHDHPERGPRKVMRGDPNSNPAFGGYTFTRNSRGFKYDPQSGYSSMPSEQFRCVINPTPIKPSSSK